MRPGSGRKALIKGRSMSLGPLGPPPSSLNPSACRILTASSGSRGLHSVTLFYHFNMSDQEIWQYLPGLRPRHLVHGH